MLGAVPQDGRIEEANTMTDAAEPHIRIIENGPYLVSGGPLLTRRAPAMSTHGEPLD
jgi:hypothetical protein